VGVGARHTLFPVYWHLALGLVSNDSGYQLPDANLRCKRNSRPLSRAVRTVSGATCRVRLLRRGRPPLAFRESIRRSKYPPAKLIRYSPLTLGRLLLMAGRWPRVTGLASYPSGCFSLQSGDSVFRSPEAGVLPEIASSSSSPLPRLPLRIPIAPRNPTGEPGSPGVEVTCWFPVATVTISVTGFTSTAETVCCWKRDSDRSRFLQLLSRCCTPGHRSPPYFPIAFLGQVRPRPGKQVTSAFRAPPKQFAEGARVPTAPDRFAVSGSIPERSQEPNIFHPQGHSRSIKELSPLYRTPGKASTLKST